MTDERQLEAVAPGAEQPARLEGLDLLRGLAALAVCWFHLIGYGNNNPSFEVPEVVKWSAMYGWLGVPCFFVLSGFVVPLSMQRARYRLSRFHRFLLRRIVRLDPPYLATVLLCLAIPLLASRMPWFKPVNVTAPQVLAHFGYANAVLGYEWLNPVFWTLAIELQFYLAIGLCFPLIAHAHLAVRTVSVLVLCGLSFAPVNGEAYLPQHLGLFLIGVIAFHAQWDRASRATCFVALAIVATSVWIVKGPPDALVGLGTFAFISLGRQYRPPGVLAWLGTVSYSLYLLHHPIGIRALNFGGRFLEPTPLNVLAVPLLGVVAALGAAFVLHRWVEAPAQRWARRIDY